ncbi:hypothetical protein AB0E62_34185 [Streptomyces sp. NPDC038707]|uniref:hypothetical protein n=1 Tax=Streptomyces sp. NPDC038707 TaxID=3154329 RepID=UPI0033F8CA19
MAKTWGAGDERRFARDIQLGKPYYIVYKIAQNLAPYEDAELYSEIVFTGRLPFTNTPCTEYGSDAATILRCHGPIHDTPPRRMRNIADVAASVGAPLGDNYEGILDAAEIRGLEKRVADSSDPRKRTRLGAGRW